MRTREAKLSADERKRIYIRRESTVYREASMSAAPPQIHKRLYIVSATRSPRCRPTYLPTPTAALHALVASSPPPTSTVSSLRLRDPQATLAPLLYKLQVQRHSRSRIYPVGCMRTSSKAQFAEQIGRSSDCHHRLLSHKDSALCTKAHSALCTKASLCTLH